MRPHTPSHHLTGTHIPSDDVLPAPSARRYLTPGDEDFDNMHHALGRPDGPWVEPYRNYFSCAAEGPDAERFAVLGSYWHRGALFNRGQDAVYHVTPHGIREVMAWLALRRDKAGTRPWLVSGGGLTPRTVVAKSASAAKYSVYLDLNDLSLWSDFRAFLASGVNARAAA